MRIGIEGQRLFRKKKHGMDMVALEMIRNLQKIDKENEYFIFVKPDEDRACLDETDNFKIVELQASSYPIWEQVALPKAALEYKLDVLHCTSNTAPVNCPVPLVLTLHDIIYLEKNNLTANGFTWYQRLGNMYRKWVVPKVLKKCETVITVSEFERKRIADQLVMTADTLLAVYNGVGKHFKPVQDLVTIDRVRKTYNLPEKFFFFLGNTDPKKNTKRVIHAYIEFCRKTSNPPHLVIADYDPQLVSSMLTEFDGVEFSRQFIFPGYVHNEDLPTIYSLANIFLYPSVRESFGIPILEAMACETPVITSQVASMPEVAGDAALLVDPTDVEQITQAMLDLASDPALRRALIEKGVVRAEEFSWKETASKVRNIYLKCA